MKLTRLLQVIGCFAAVAANSAALLAQTSNVYESEDPAWAEELAVNEGILSYHNGDYYGARQTLAAVAPQSFVASAYCDLCDQNMQSADLNSTGFGDESDCMVSESIGDSCDDSGQKNWNVAVLSGYLYDSNVSATPVFTGLGAVTDKEDSAFYLASFGDIRLAADERRNVGLIGSTYNNWYSEQSDFDVADYMLGGYVNSVLADNVIGGIRYEYHQTLLGSESFSGEHRLVPNVSILGEKGHVTAFYEFDAVNFSNEPLIPALDPTAHVHAVGVTRAHYFGQRDSGRLFWGYRYDNVSADGSDFDRDTHQTNLRVEIPVSNRLIYDAGIRYFWDDYNNANSLDFHERPRSDRRAEARTGIQMILSPKLSTRVDYTYVGSDSNVENLFGVRFFDYSKHTLTAQLIFDF